MGARSFTESGDGPPEMLLLRDRRLPARPPKENATHGPALINGDGREKFQRRVAAAGDIAVARNVAVLSSLW